MSRIARVGLIGIGRMGTPMAARLVEAGYDVAGFDPSPEARARLVAIGGTEVDRVDALVDRDLLILMLPNSQIVQSVLVGSGLLDRLDGGRTVVVDMSSSEPMRTRALRELADERGVTLIDAPVSGGVPGAVKGTLAVMVGGSEAEVAAVRPVLETFGPVTHVGGIGAGHALKALNNMLSAVTMLATSEAMHAGIAFGLDPTLMAEVISRSSGRSGSSDNKWPNFVIPGTYDAGFSASMLLKDMRIATALADDLGVPFRSNEQVADLWQEAIDELGGDIDHTEIARWVEIHIETRIEEPR